jgi:hypothetical protein
MPEDMDNGRWLPILVKLRTEQRLRARFDTLLGTVTMEGSGAIWLRAEGV